MFCLLFPIQFSWCCGNQTCEKKMIFDCQQLLKNTYLYKPEYKLIFKTLKVEKKIYLKLYYTQISWHLSSILFLSPTIITFWPAMNL